MDPHDGVDQGSILRMTAQCTHIRGHGATWESAGAVCSLHGRTGGVGRQGDDPRLVVPWRALGGMWRPSDSGRAEGVEGGTSSGAVARVWGALRACAGAGADQSLGNRG